MNFIYVQKRNTLRLRQADYIFKQHELVISMSCLLILIDIMKRRKFL